MPTNAQVVDHLRSGADDVTPHDGGFGFPPVVREGYPDIRYRTPEEMRALADRIATAPQDDQWDGEVWSWE